MVAASLRDEDLVLCHVSGVSMVFGVLISETKNTNFALDLSWFIAPSYRKARWTPGTHGDAPGMVRNAEPDDSEKTLGGA